VEGGHACDRKRTWWTSANGGSSVSPTTSPATSRDGHVIVEVDRIDSVDEWRAAARVAARRHGWKVRTGMGRGNGHVFAARVDPEAERGWTGWS
jgi:hypothetical protein